MQQPTEQEKKERGAEGGLERETEARLSSFHSLPTFAYALPLCSEYTELLSNPEAGGRRGEGQKNGQMKKEKFQ